MNPATATAAPTKEYHRPMPATWWLRNRHLVAYIIRELTSVFIAAYAVFLLYLLSATNRAGKDAAAVDAIADRLNSPGWYVFHVLVFVFAIYHSITWFNLTPQALVLWRGEERVSPVLIAGAHYGLWIILSLLILLYALS
jgi:fumarate reductase subunit C